jgi:hypothetical protein
MTDDAASTEVPQPSPRRWVRGVRIGASVFFGMVTVALVVLWVRSYWSEDFATWTSRPKGYNSDPNGFFYVWSGLGELGCSGYWTTSYRIRGPYRWQGIKVSPPEKPHRSDTTLLNRMGFLGGWEVDGASPEQFGAIVPYWFVTSLLLIVALVVWPLNRSIDSIRFSLRTMLIATTLAAAILGFVVWISS